MANVHATAIVDPTAKLAGDVSIGAYSIIGPDVTVGAGCTIGPHVVIAARTTLGARNRVFQFASIGDIAQDRKYGGEPTRTVIGDDNLFREYVSIHAGTVQGRSQTTIGDRNLFLAYSHVAHDCIVGNDTTWSNNAQIAGHVRIDDWVVLGAFAGVHQFCRVGAAQREHRGPAASRLHARPDPGRATRLQDAVPRGSVAGGRQGEARQRRAGNARVAAAGRVPERGRTRHRPMNEGSSAAGDAAAPALRAS